MVPTGNPFGFPGMPGSAPSFDQGTGNPVAQSLEMMRQVWGNMGNMAGAAPSNPTAGLDELDKRITDLKAIENWLNLNLTMLRGSIQGLEVQRATISTLRSFAQNVSSAYAASPEAAGGASGDLPPASPLEIVLGLRPAPGQPKAAPTAPAAPAAPAADATPQPASSADAAAGTDVPAANAWWSMLQDQFAKIATATAQAVPAPDISKQVAAVRTIFEPSKAPDAPPKKTAARKAAPAKRAPAKKAAVRRSRGSA